MFVRSVGIYIYSRLQFVKWIVRNIYNEWLKAGNVTIDLSGRLWFWRRSKIVPVVGCFW